jgi:hypothetical protein
MSHSSMLKTRRKRQKGKKELAGVAKRAKKQGKAGAKKDHAAASTKKKAA